MRTRNIPALGVGITALATVLAFAPGANATTASSHISLSHRSTTHPVQQRPSAKSCYSQLDNDNGIGIVSQKFEKALAIYKNRGADDFMLGSSCSVQSVDVAGMYFNGSGPAKRIQVMFYPDDGGTPGPRLTFRGTASYVEHDNGNFHIPFDTPVDLSPGTYWVSVRVRMDFSGGGEWGWNTNNTQRGAPAVWKNYHDGFSTGCTVYEVLTTCVPAGEGPDFTFSINDTP